MLKFDLVIRYSLLFTYYSLVITQLGVISLLLIMSLQKEYRLKGWRNFQKVYEKGKVFHSNYFVLKALFIVSPQENSSVNNHLPPTCLGISLSKKVSKKAVVRNRIKRLIKASFRQLAPFLSPGWQLIIIVRPSAIEAKFRDVSIQLQKLFTKASLIK